MPSKFREQNKKAFFFSSRPPSGRCVVLMVHGYLKTMGPGPLQVNSKSLKSLGLFQISKISVDLDLVAITVMSPPTTTTHETFFSGITLKPIHV